MSSKPHNRTNQVRSIENLSISPIALSFCLCINFSTWTVDSLKGYWKPASWYRALYNALISSKLLLPQQRTVGSVETTLTNCYLNIKLLFTAGTSRLQWASDNVNNALQSHKPNLKFSHKLVITNSGGDTHSSCKRVAVGFRSQARQ